MTAGDPRYFALESEITHAYERLSLRALGFFVIHVDQKAYGIKAWDATMLAVAFDGVRDRIALRGSHSAAVLSSADAGQIASALSRAIYCQHEEDELFFGLPSSEFVALFHSARLVWAPDGEEGFDDASCVLQFDIEDQVRLIAFTRNTHPFAFDPGSLRELWLPAEKFYSTLQEWHDRFLGEWASLPKVFERVQ